MKPQRMRIPVFMYIERRMSAKLENRLRQVRQGIFETIINVSDFLYFFRNYLLYLTLLQDTMKNKRDEAYGRIQK